MQSYPNPNAVEIAFRPGPRRPKLNSTRWLHLRPSNDPSSMHMPTPGRLATLFHNYSWRLATSTRPLTAGISRVQWRRFPAISSTRLLHSSVESEEPTERFYQFYLEEINIKQKGIETCPWLRGREADAATDALEHVYQADPLPALESPSCDIELAGRCLEAFVLRAHEQTESRADARKRLMIAKPGTRALHWLLQSGAYPTADLALEPRFLTYTAHCLTAEGNDERVITWLQSGHVPEHLKHLSYKQARSWQGVLLMLLVEHRVFWANDDLNLAFMPLIKAFMWNQGPPRPPTEREIPLQQSVVWTLQQLRNSRNASVDPRQYDRFTALYKRHFANTERHLFDLDLAHLALFHPTHPSADLALRHILSWPHIAKDEPFYQRYLQPQAKAIAYYIMQFVVWTARMLAQDPKRTAEAREALRIGRVQLPELFNMQSISRTVQDVKSEDRAFDRTVYFKVRKVDANNGYSVQRKFDVLAAKRRGNFW